VLPADVRPPSPTRLAEVTWLDPYPDLLLDELVDTQPGPEARVEAREAISLAFVTALQLLPPRQRATLILRDVLGFTAREVAAMLDVTEQSVTSALKRARATLSRDADADAPPQERSDVVAEQEQLDRLVTAFERGDVAGIVAVLTEDVWLRMPPIPLEYQGRDLVGQFFATVAFRDSRRYRLVRTQANGQPAFGAYLRDPHGGPAHPFGLLVLTMRADRISAITRFDNVTFGSFGLPRRLPD
jgi:RNA polymerase sigma-70 factor (ECF subfamily)